MEVLNDGVRGVFGHAGKTGHPEAGGGRQRFV
jgi:hypothetical protein